MGSVRPGEVIELFQFGQFGVQIDISGVTEQLIELLLVGSVGSFDLAVKLERAGFDEAWRMPFSSTCQ